MLLNTFTTTAYERHYRQAVLDLIFHNRRTHSHLDWHQVGQWLDTHPAITRIAWRGDEAVGVLAASAPLNGASWLRLAAVTDRISARSMLKMLWKSLVTEMMRKSIALAAVLVMDDWLADYLPNLGFEHQEDVITLARTKGARIRSKPPAVTIRPAYSEDIHEIAIVDHMAFPIPWQLSQAELYQARRLSAFCTVALDKNGEIIGYQLSTYHQKNGHLARLAVCPRIQSRGVGSALLNDVIDRFAQRRIYTMSVNTQASNYRSRHLYARYGFQRTGYDLGVWTVGL